ncbi:SOS response-associated peptidase [Thiohalomonas denitrificans]|uniref:SOS response-associated peptidase n=1 Tax=Thiohalomonas denitrificans TaxID=415747 RepID=UPI0026EB7D02|nr:SOS response-associated peptidase [Thiohalomonas denitrificans]
MCGRFDQHHPTSFYAERLGMPTDRQYGDLAARYNVAPSEAPLVARWSEYGGGPELVTLYWGLIPHWSRDPGKGPKPINARAESVNTKPMFRDSFRRRRCLVPADGFFEWRKEGTIKQPYYFRFRNGEPMFFAGLWDRWSGEGPPRDTFTIIVTEPNELAARYHDRMPAVLKMEWHRRWLNPDTPNLAELHQILLEPYPASEMEVVRVSRAVNDPKNKGRETIQPE